MAVKKEVKKSQTLPEIKTLPRIQTAEGWKRSQLMRAKTKKAGKS